MAQIRPFVPDTSNVTPKPDPNTSGGDFGNPTDILKGTHVVSPNSKGAPKPFPGSGSGALYTNGKGYWVFRDGQTKKYDLWTWRGNGPWVKGASKTTEVTKAHNAITSVTGILGDVWGTLTNPAFWLRVGEGFLGLILIAIGFSKLTGVNVPIASKIAKLA